MIKKKKISITDVNRVFIYKLLAKRNLRPEHVYISKHFLDRYQERRIDDKDMVGVINKLADNICQVIYSLHCGKDTKIRYNNIVIEMLYDTRLVIKTCYDKTNYL